MRHRLRLVRLTTELPHTRRTGVDVIDSEVHPDAVLAGLHVGDRAACLVADLGHVVLERPRKRLELPTEHGPPELASLRGVIRRDLEMHYLARHSSLLPPRRWAVGVGQSRLVRILVLSPRARLLSLRPGR